MKIIVPVRTIILTLISLFVTCPQLYADYQLAAAADQQGVYCVLTQQNDAGSSFKIYYRPQAGTHFIPNQTLPGQPLALTAAQNRLHIFFQNSQRSYGLHTTPRSEPPLPANLTTLAAAAYKDNIYTLVRAEQPVTLTSTDGTLELQPQQTILLNRTEHQAYQPFRRNTLPNLQKITISATEKTVHLFGLDDQNQIKYFIITPDKISDPLIFTIENTQTITALTLNHQPALIIAAGPDDKCEFTLATFENKNLLRSAPLELKLNTQLIAPAHALAFTAWDQTITAFQAKNEYEIVTGSYTADGKLAQPLTNPITLLATTEEIVPLFLLGPTAGGILMAICMAVIIIKRRNAFNPQNPLPDFVKPAPLFRRLLAFVIDAFPASSLTMSLVFPDLQQQLPAENLFTDPELYLQYLPLLTTVGFVASLGITVYLTIIESLLGTSPGKMIMRLVVITEDITPIKRPQALIRNLARAVELHPQVQLLILIITIFTKRRQRPGDLLARTFVTTANPQLFQHLLNQHLKNKRDI